MGEELPFCGSKRIFQLLSKHQQIGELRHKKPYIRRVFRKKKQNSIALNVSKPSFSMKQYLFIFSSLLLGLSACHSPKEPQAVAEPPLLAYFKPMPTADTLHLEMPIGEEVEKLGDTIPNALFFSSLDSAWLHEIEHVADSNEAMVHGKGRFALANGFDACLVEIHLNWFKHQSLLVYDKQRHAFTGRVTVAEWYGGESGQVLTGSWLFDNDADGSKDLVQREIEHWMKMDDNDEPQETFVERASLLLFKEGKFTASATVDSATLVKRFPIKSAW
jgi:hypothetical protein